MDEEQKTSSGTKGSDPGGSDPKVTQPTPEERCAELEHSWKRALADYQNLKKDVQKEREEMASFAVVRVIETDLPGHEVFYIASPDTIGGHPLVDTVRELYDGAGIAFRDLERADASAISSAKAQRLLGWTPTRSWRDYLDDDGRSRR